MDRNFFYCLSGTLLEWYDFALFGALSSVMSNIIFHRSDKITALLLVFAVFATAFLIRPFGGIITGHIGDRYGRKPAIVISVLSMAVASLGMAALPVNTRFYWLTVLLFVLFRLVQGFSVGGEMAGVVLLLLEHAGVKRPFMRLSFLMSSIYGGLLLGTYVGGVAVHFYARGFHNAWRVPYLVSLALGIVGLYFRTKVSESSAFLEMVRSGKTLGLPIKAVVTKHYKMISVVTVLAIPSSVSTYYAFVYYPAYLTQLGMNAVKALYVGKAGIVVTMLIILVIGRFANKHNIPKLIGCGLLGFAVFPAVATVLVSLSIKYALLSQMIYAVLIASVSSVFVPYVSSLFPENVRLSATSLCVNIAILFGGIAPFLSQAMIKATGNYYAPSLYVIAVSIVAAVVFLTNRKKIVI